MPANENENNVSRTTLEYLGGILISGAIGGLLFWVVGKWTGTPMPNVFGRGTFLALMFVGALAAAFGVFLLTASDLTAIRTYVFAVVCGLVWQPMIDSAERIATNATATSQTAEVGIQVDKVKAAAAGGNTDQIDAAIRNTTPAVNEALKLSPNLSDAKRTEITDSSKQAINVLQSNAAAAPDATVDALKNISLTAASSGEPGVALHAVESLRAIGAAAKGKSEQKLADKAAQSLAALATQSSDLTVRNAARSAVSQIALEKAVASPASH